ncbi:methyltransferase domain-containing protein [Streptomyces liangshanensis]|uniref:Methyltransferase domain-containing protein n=1 Tax=Streptomyces liangshanensis TaxID=2717324 RepID=A0A6G9H0Z6_9ACTN|nr:methyltransferase domain-containing protein [Streptomyces liangshanensis]QIQ03797.1 methyltransferase domain-containing protein [Streptomyces liangshanensis]
MSNAPAPVREAGASTVVDYRLGSSGAEQERLLAQCELLRPAAVALLDTIPLPPGANALDLGCGPLGVLDLLSERVGPAGSVTGLDTDDRMIGWARESAAALALGNVEVRHEALSPDTAAGETYDLAHCRLLLINTTHPRLILGAMAAAVRPGGWVAVQEFDWATWQCDPPHPAWSRLKTLLTGIFGGDVHIGARLPGLLAEAGLTDVRAAAHAYYWQPGDRYQTLLLSFAGLFRERLLEHTPLTPRELDALTGALGDHLARPGTTVRESLLVQAWGRKP